MSSETGARTVAEVQHRIADLRARLPRHSAPAAMLIELEEMEEYLHQLQQQDTASQHSDSLD
ncbi:MAG: histidine kinase [Chloroflexi bacterium]|nr:histidine kinase [Chloroflexota bacterium]